MISGFGGADLIRTDVSIPTLITGGFGADEIYGGEGFDTLDGGDGFDTSLDNGEIEISIEN